MSSETENLSIAMLKFKKQYANTAYDRIKWLISSNTEDPNKWVIAENLANAIVNFDSEIYTSIYQTNKKTKNALIDCLDDPKFLKTEYNTFFQEYLIFLQAQEQDIYDKAVNELEQINDVQEYTDAQLEEVKNIAIGYLIREKNGDNVRIKNCSISRMKIILEQATQGFQLIQQEKEKIKKVQKSWSSNLKYFAFAALSAMAGWIGTYAVTWDSDANNASIVQEYSMDQLEPITAMTPQNLKDSFIEKNQNFIDEKINYIQIKVDRATWNGRNEVIMKEYVKSAIKNIYQWEPFTIEKYKKDLANDKIPQTGQFMNIGNDLMEIQEDYKIKYQKFLENEKMAQVIGVTNAIFWIKKTTSIATYQALQQTITDISKNTPVDIKKLVKKLSQEYTEEELVFITKMLEKYQVNVISIQKEQRSIPSN